MSTKIDLTKAGAAALVMAFALILGTSLTGIMPSIIPINPSAQRGTLSILITDPPQVPDGVTAIYITYFDLEVHASNAGNQSGWIRIQNQGAIELMGTVNMSQTLSSAQIESGVYNILRFNISSAQVTYNGVNYTAFVPTSRLFIPIIHGVQVNASQFSAVIIDITPTVVNIGSRANPEFIIRHVAKAYRVPSGEVTDDIKHPGYRMALIGKLWWRQIQENSTIAVRITGASLTENTLQLTVQNTRNQDIAIRTVLVTPLSSAFEPNQKSNDHWKKGRIPASISDSATFIVLQNGTLVSTQNFLPLSSDRPSIVKALFEEIGYTLDSGTSVSLTYSGTITLSLKNIQNHDRGIVPGQQYLVTVMGDNALAGIVVVAS